MAMRNVFLTVVAMAMLLLPHDAEAGSYRRILIARGEVTGDIVSNYFGSENATCFLVPLFDFATNERVGNLFDCLGDITPDPFCQGGSNVTSTFNFTVDSNEIIFRA